MTDDTPNLTAPGQPPDGGAAATPDEAPEGQPDASQPISARPPSAADARAHRPDYKGAELDPERGPGLGCFWFQLIVLGFFIVLIPIGLKLGWPFELLAILLFVVIGLLLLTGQSVIFLLRLVAADRRSQGRRRPLASSTKTVGELEDQNRAAAAVGGDPGDTRDLPSGSRAASAASAASADAEVVAADEPAPPADEPAPPADEPAPPADEPAPPADEPGLETLDQPTEEPDPGVRQ